MRSIKHLIPIGIFFLSIFAFSIEEMDLSELYKAAKIRLEQEVVLDDGSMSDDTFFESLGTISCDPEGNIYVVDSGSLNIKKFDAGGKFLKTIGRAGQGPGEFGRLYYSTFAKDRLVVWDAGNRRLNAFAPEGQLIESTNIDYDEGFVRKLGSLPTGEIVIEREKTYRNEPDKAQDCFVDIYSPDLEFERTVYKKNLWRKKYIRTEDYGISTLYFPYSSDVYWEASPEGYIIIGFSEKYELEAYDKEGNKIFSFAHTYEPTKVTEKDKIDYFDSLEFYRMGERLKEPPEYVTKYTEFPRFKPAFKNILVDSEGNILVVLNREEKEEQGRVFDVFDPKGRFISSVRIEGSFTLPDTRNIYLHNGFLYVIEIDEDDLYRVIKYKIKGI